MPAIRQLFAFAMCISCAMSWGCAVTRKSASYDSTSKMPWMGLELATPRRAPAPETHRIRLEGSIPLEPEPAKLVVAKPRKVVSKSPIKMDASITRGPIPIPRTDLTDAPQPALSAGPELDELGPPEF